MKIIVLTLKIFLFTQIGFCQSDYFSTVEKDSRDGGAAIIEKQDGNLLIATSSWRESSSSFDILLTTIDSFSGETIEEKYFGNPNTFESVHSIQQTLDGGYVLGGSIEIDSKISPYLMKLDSNENLEWDLILPNSDISIKGSYAFQHSNQSYFILGRSNIQHLITLIYNVDNDGNLILASTLDNIWGEQLIESQDNNLMVLGSFFFDYIPLEGYNSNAILVKLNMEGTILWTKEYSNSEGPLRGRSIVKTNEGEYLLACFFEPETVGLVRQAEVFKVDSIGNIQNKREFDGAPIYIKKVENGFVLSAERIFQDTKYEMIAYVLNENGDWMCREYFDGYFNLNNGANIIQSSNDNIYVVGYFNEPADIFISKLTSNCDIITDIIENRIDSKVKVYPNPVNEMITIKDIPKFSTLIIYNQIGEIVFTNNIEDSILQIDTNSWTQGMYGLVIHKGKNTQTKRILKL